ncbi:unnamed protein product [Meganyctiphanes norvegica]|uniref:C-type lectin domain-containing protein n=1 Tax=Meganyctiphanes norvegica TaxID=48144 RepID=A0AAV2RTU8_MEGNR
MLFNGLILFLMVAHSHQQDICGQMVLENLSHIMDARFSALDIRLNYITSTLNDAVIKQDFNNEELIGKISELLEEKLSTILEDKLSDMSDNLLQMKSNIGDAVAKQDSNNQVRNDLEVKISEIGETLHQINSTIEGIVAKTDEKNQEVIGYLQGYEYRQSNYLEKSFIDANNTLIQVESTLVSVVETLDSIKNLTEEMEMKAMTFGESSSQVYIIQENTTKELKDIEMNKSSIEENVMEALNNSTTLLQIELHDVHKNSIEEMNEYFVAFEQIHNTSFERLEDIIENFQKSLSASVDEIKEPVNEIKNSVNNFQKSLSASVDEMIGPVNEIKRIVNRCPTADGFFMSPGSNQCFKHFLEQKRSWTEADSKCKSEGLALAKPYNVNVLREYLVQRYGACNHWLGARGDGKIMKWVRDQKPLSSDTPLWFEDNIAVTTDDCLLLLSNPIGWKNDLDKPYTHKACSTSNYYALCELILD